MSDRQFYYQALIDVAAKIAVTRRAMYDIGAINWDIATSPDVAKALSVDITKVNEIARTMHKLSTAIITAVTGLKELDRLEECELPPDDGGEP